MSYTAQLKQLAEEVKSAGAAMDALMAKSQGKPGQMPADDQVAFDNAAADYDAKLAEYNQFEKLDQKELQMLKMTSVISDSLPAGGKADLKSVIGDFIGGKIQRDDASLKSLTVGLSGRGGLLVGREVYNEVIQIVANANYVRRLAAVFPLNAGVGEFQLPVIETNMTRPSPTSEVGTATADTALEFGDRILRPRLRSVAMKVGRLMDIQSGVDIWNIVAQQMAYVKAEQEEREFMNGTGASEALGIFTSSALGIGSTQTVTTAAANTIAADDVLDTHTLLRGQFRNNRTSWLMHRNTEGRIRKLKDASNNYLWSSIGMGVYNAQFLTGPSPATLLGYPIYVSEYAPDPGRTGSITSGLRVLALGDYMQGYAIADNINMEIVELDQAAFPAKQWGLVAAFDGRPYNQDATAILQVQ